MEQKNNTGVLFKNEKKEKETHPDAKGSCLIDGIEYWISAWRNNSKDGKAYTSLKFEPKKTEPLNKTTEQETEQDDITDELPF